MKKIFCIGLNKTGTSTLGRCLDLLGFKHTSFSLSLLEQVATLNYGQLYTTISKYDSFSDWPYPLVFKHLDQVYPGSRFLLTLRSTPEIWLDSLASHALRTDPIMGSRARSLAYGYPYPQLNPQAHLSMYNHHLQEVRSYFFGRPDDLLEICWEQGSSFDDLCIFLGCESSNASLPHSNSAKNGNLANKSRNLNLLQWYVDKIGQNN
jgi:hypothetical protein